MNRNIFFLILSLIIVFLFAMISPPAGMTESAMFVLGIFLAAILLWIAVGIDWPSLFCILILMFVPGLTTNNVIASSMGNATVSFLIFTFCCSHALSQTAFTRRCAIMFLSTPLAKKGPWWFLWLYFLSILTLGSCMSTTVIVLIYLVINEEIFALLGLKKGDKFAAMMTMGLIIIASISGAMTPIAHVFPLTALSIYEGITGQTISYMAYMAGGIPAALAAVAAMLAMFRFILRPDTSAMESIDVQSIKNGLPPADSKEKKVVAIFFGVVALWVMPEIVKGIIPTVSAYISRFGTVGPALLGTILLCTITDKGKPVMNLGEAIKTVPWPSVFMAASCLALGAAMTSADIGLSDWLKAAIGPMMGSFNGFAFVLILIAISAVMTNVGSNMVTVAVATTIGVPVAMTMGGAVNPAAVAVAVGMISTYAFATPPAMTTVVLGTGTGWTNNGQMAKYGFLFLIPSILAVAVIAYPICSALL